MYKKRIFKLNSFENEIILKQKNAQLFSLTHISQIFKIYFLLKLHVFRFLESENHVFSSWSVCMPLWICYQHNSNTKRWKFKTRNSKFILYGDRYYLKLFTKIDQIVCIRGLHGPRFGPRPVPEPACRLTDERWFFQRAEPAHEGYFFQWAGKWEVIFPKGQAEPPQREMSF